jgi:glycosyltransferase involved in cell wall biosynthesis
MNSFRPDTPGVISRSPLAEDASADRAEVPYSTSWYARLRAALGEAACRQLGFYVIPEEFLLSVVIPVYNERETLQELLGRVRGVPVRKEIVLVDDCSVDGTRDLLKELERQAWDDPHNRLAIYYHDNNRGKGAAVRTGFARAKGDVLIIQDADLEYDPAEIPRLLQPIIGGQADVVFGSRFLGDHPHRVLYFWHYLGNKVLTMLSNCFTNLNLTDMETCYKLFRREVIETIGPKLRQERFGIEPELTARVARRGYRVFEMSISYHGRTYEQGKKIGVKDGVHALWCIVRYGLAD